MSKEYISLKNNSISYRISILISNILGLIQLPTSIKNFIDKHKSPILAILFGGPVIYMFFFPFVTGTITGTSFYLTSLTLAAIFAGMALTLNLEAGFLGLPNFGKVAFIAVGAYAFAIPVNALTVGFEDGSSSLSYTTIVAIGILSSVIFTGLFGVLLTLPTLKLREDYLAITTIVAGEILRNVLNNEKNLGGFSGYKIDNPVYLKYDPELLMYGKHITATHLGVILLSLVFSYIVFYRNNNRDIAHLPADRQKYHSIMKGSSVFYLMAAFFIFLNYSRILSDMAMLSLDVMFMLLSAIFIIYRSAFVDKIDARILYGGLAFISIVDFIIGLFTGSEVTKINYVSWYTFMMAMAGMTIVFVIVEELYYSPFGRTIKAIREDDTSAISVGKSVFSYRLRALVIAGALSGFMGAIFAMFLVVINPQTFLPLVTFTLYIMMIIGGTANNKGVIFGAFVIQMLYSVTRGTFIQESKFIVSTGLDPVNMGLIIVGVTLIFFLIYAPEGIFPEKKYNNQRYYDMLYLNDEENPERNPLIAQLIKLSGSELVSDDWISEEGDK